MGYIIISIICGIAIGLLILYPKTKKIAKENGDIEIQNILIKENNKIIEELQQESKNIQHDIDNLKEIYNQIKNSKEELEKSNEDYYKSKRELVNEKINKYKEEAQKEYLELLKEENEDYNEQFKQLTSKIKELEKELRERKRAVQSAIEQAKRELEDKEQMNFYKLHLSPEDIEEISRLRTVVPYLRTAEPINKVIWSVYYLHATNDLIGRVVGKDITTGIYKITNLDTKMSYIGQSVDIGARFKQHIKRGVGAEAQTRNKLYPAMYSLGPENFSFEIIEKCSKDELNAREKYWIEYFESNSFGYNATGGGS